ncbi:MAG TPA: bifunctional hydroxymethylpyrimidine kinase/phosphomethylpyrimidine kinase [Methylibium sp.]
MDDETLRFPHPCLPSPFAEPVDPDAARLPSWLQDPRPPVIWSVAGTDSGGGAGHAADQRAAAAMGVHLCPVVAAVTAQNSQGVQAVYPLPAEQIEAQMLALSQDLRPRVVKTGLLGSTGAVEAVARSIDVLRERGPVGLVVDPVLGATAGGAAFADAAVLAAYRELLLPRATLVTPNRREAERLAGVAPGAGRIPELAAELMRLGPQAVCITGGDEQVEQGSDELALDWFTGHIGPWLPNLGSTSGWLALPRLASRHHHGSGCSFASGAAAALARGFALPDAMVLAKMLAWCGIRDGHAAGAGSGPLRPSAGLVCDPRAMPVMSFGDEPLDEVILARWRRVLSAEHGVREHAGFARGLYAITDQPQRVEALAASGCFAHVQLRIKSRSGADEAQEQGRIRAAVRQAVGGVGDSACRLWINDHWRLALEEGAPALHLGQEDWTALSRDDKALLLAEREAGRLELGLSSHSLWELARARGLAPSYVACGPVWETTTKRMPWLPQGLSHLAWWTRMAGRPVVAIGGILSSQRLARCAQAGASGACLVRAAEDSARWAEFAQAWRR